MTGKLKVINLFAGPGAGKSTTRAGLFNLMKKRGLDCEEVTEYAKDVTWEGNTAKLSDQLYILAKQNRKLERLRGKVEWVISDSPIILSLHYAPLNYFPKTFQNLVWDLWKSYDNYYFFINRTEVYDPVGRNQNEEEAKAIDYQIQVLLENNCPGYSEVDASERTEAEIFKRLAMSGVLNDN